MSIRIDLLRGLNRVLGAVRDSVSDALESGLPRPPRLSAEGRSLRDAVDRDDPSRVRDLLAAGADPEERDESGEAALHRAARRGATASVRALLAGGASKDSLDRRAEQPLALALRGGHRAAAGLLLTRAGCSRRDAEGLTAMHRIVALGDVELLRLALAAGGNLRVTSSRGKAAWVAALESGAPELMALAASHRSAREGEAAATAWPLHAAAARGLDEATVLLARGCDPNARDERGRTPLFAAVAADRLDVAELLVSARADASVRDAAGDSLLAVAASSAAVGWLVAHRVDLEAVGARADEADASGVTPLAAAAAAGHAGAVRWLLANGAGLDRPDARGWTPLQRAAAAGRGDVVELLLERGARHGPAPDGRSLLELAVEANSVRAVVALERAGLPLERPRSPQAASVEAALFGGRYALAFVLQRLTGTDALWLYQPQGFVAVRNGQADAAELVKGDTPTEAVDVAGRGMLHAAAAEGTAAVVAAWLDQRHAWVDQPEWLYGATPLHLARLLGHEDVAKVLLDRGASPLLRTRLGHTPDDLASPVEGQVVELRRLEVELSGAWSWFWQANEREERLNRSGLVEARQSAAADVRELLGQLRAMERPCPHFLAP